MYRYLIAAAIALALVPLADALAQGPALTTEAAERFVATLPVLSEKRDQFPDEIAGEDIMPSMGERFAPYSTAVAELRARDSAALDTLAEVAADHGFADVEDWAGTGDTVIAAYLAYKMGNQRSEIKQMREHMTPEMLDQMPPSMRPQMEAAMAMAQAIESVPEADIEAVSPVAADLEAAVDMPMPMK